MLTLMTLNNLEPLKQGVLVNFLRFLAATCISRVKCTKMVGDRLRQPAYEIFSIGCRFMRAIQVRTL